MTRVERLLLLAFFAAVLALLTYARPVPALLGVLLFGIAFVPFIGDDLFIGAAAAATTLPAVLTAWRLRR